MAGSLTPEQKRFRDMASGKLRSESDDLYFNEHLPWVNITTNTTNAKVDPAMATPAKKYRASLVIETNDLDRGSVTVQRLLSVDLASDDFAELVAKAHGHLELAMDK